MNTILILFQMEKLCNFLRDMNRAVLSGGILDKAHKPDFYIVCPCSSYQLQLNTNGMDCRIASTEKEKRDRPFDPYKNWKTYFDAVRENQDGLTPAYRLYMGNKGVESPYFKCHNNNKGKMFCLSSAWGIVRSDFCLPHYNVNFAKKSDSSLDSSGEYANPDWKKGMAMAFNHLEAVDERTPIVVMGGLEYIKRFLFLHEKMKNPLVIFHNSDGTETLLFKYKNSRNGLEIRQIRVAKAEKRMWYYKYMEII